MLVRKRFPRICSSQGVTSVKRIKVHWNKEIFAPNIFILTFDEPTLPGFVKTGYLRIPVVPYILNPLLYKVKHFATDKIHAVTDVLDVNNAYQHDVTCINCGLKHATYSR